MFDRSIIIESWAAAASFRARRVDSGPDPDSRSNLGERRLANSVQGNNMYMANNKSKKKKHFFQKKKLLSIFFLPFLRQSTTYGVTMRLESLLPLHTKSKIRDPPNCTCPPPPAAPKRGNPQDHPSPQMPVQSSDSMIRHTRSMRSRPLPLRCVLSLLSLPTGTINFLDLGQPVCMCVCVETERKAVSMVGEIKSISPTVLHLHINNPHPPTH